MAKITDEIRSWFQQVKKVEYQLPDGTLSGKPGDVRFGLVNIYAENERLFIELLNDFNISASLTELFIFQGFTQIRFIDNCLDIYGFESLMVKWRTEISPGSKRFDGKIDQPETHLDEYDEGTVRFVPYGFLNPVFRF